MPRKPIDLTRKIKDILQHVQKLPDEAKAPILHYQRAGTDLLGTLNYIERALGQGNRYATVADRHVGRVYGMALISFVQAFERFLKEIAGECVDSLAAYIVDDRFDKFEVSGTKIASHFEAGTIGKSLCESSTWFGNQDINERFRRLLADPYDPGSFWLFPRSRSQGPTAEIWRFETLNLVWQIRHTLVHNVGVVTKSDSARLRLLAKEPVTADRILAPNRDDLGYLKRFLDETAEVCNKRIGERLAELLTTIRAPTPTLFDPQTMADRLASIFRLPLQVAGATGVVPPD